MTVATRTPSLTTEWSYNMPCVHGVVASTTELREVLAWAARRYPDKDLADVGFVCWIIAYREWAAKQPKEK